MLRIIAITIAITLAPYALTGCDEATPSPDDKARHVADIAKSLPPGSTVEFNYFDNSVGGTAKADETASGAGPGLSTHADEIAGQFQASAPQAMLTEGHGGVSGGSTSFSMKVASKRINVLQIIGALLLVGAAVAAVYATRRLAGLLAVAGVAMILVGSFLQLSPIAIIAIIGGAVGIGVAYHIYIDRADGLKTKVLNAVVPAVEKLPDEHAQLVKDAVATGAGSALPAIKNIISRIKIRIK